MFTGRSLVFHTPSSQTPVLLANDTSHPRTTESMPSAHVAALSVHSHLVESHEGSGESDPEDPFLWRWHSARETIPALEGFDNKSGCLQSSGGETVAIDQSSRRHIEGIRTQVLTNVSCRSDKITARKRERKDGTTMRGMNERKRPFTKAVHPMWPRACDGLRHKPDAFFLHLRMSMFILGMGERALYKFTISKWYKILKKHTDRLEPDTHTHTCCCCIFHLWPNIWNIFILKPLMIVRFKYKHLLEQFSNRGSWKQI